MRREDAIAELLKVQAPLGPFREPDEPDKQQEAWARTAGLDALDAMFSLASDPPPAGQTGRLSAEAFEFEVSRMLALLATQHPQAFAERAEALLRDPVARPAIIDALGMTNRRESLDLLASLVRAAGLTEQEGVRLASALGELGGPEAVKLLAQLRERTPESQIAVIDEIEIAMRLTGRE